MKTFLLMMFLVPFGYLVSILGGIYSIDRHGYRKVLGYAGFAIGIAMGATGFLWPIGQHLLGYRIGEW
jgi:hypothetical protein